MADEQMFRTTEDIPKDMELSIESFKSNYLVPVALKEFPAMVYNHPLDPTMEHKTAIVATQDELDAKLAEGYKREPHIPAAIGLKAEEAEYEVKPADGSGTERWGSSDWTQTEGKGLTDETSYTGKVVQRGDGRFDAFKEDRYIGTVDSEAEARLMADGPEKEGE